MKNNRISNWIFIGTILIVMCFLFANIYPIMYSVGIIIILVLQCYLYTHADFLSHHERGSVKWHNYRYVSLFSTVCILCVYIGILWSQTFGVQDFRMSFIIIVFVAVYGNLAPKIPFNRTLGLRLPWTIRDEATWRYAHRITGYTTIPCLVVMVVGCVTQHEHVYAMGILFWILIPSIQSFIFYKNRRKQL